MIGLYIFSLALAEEPDVCVFENTETEEVYDLRGLRSETTDWTLSVTEVNGEKPTYYLNFCRPTVLSCATGAAGFCRKEGVYTEPLGTFNGAKLQLLTGQGDHSPLSMITRTRNMMI